MNVNHEVFPAVDVPKSKPYVLDVQRKNDLPYVGELRNRFGLVNWNIVVWKFAVRRALPEGNEAYRRTLPNNVMLRKGNLHASIPAMNDNKATAGCWELTTYAPKPDGVWHQGDGRLFWPTPTTTNSGTSTT